MYTRQFARRALEVMQTGGRTLPRSEYPLQEVHEEEALRLFSTLSFNDKCEDAGLVDFAHYLRGCTGLCIPERWKPLIPRRL